MPKHARKILLGLAIVALAVIVGIIRQQTTITTGQPITDTSLTLLWIALILIPACISERAWRTLDAQCHLVFLRRRGADFR